MSNTTLGFAVITSAVLIAVIIYTVIKLRNQVGRVEKKEKDKKKASKN